MNVLVLAPHPDDESIGLGGTLWLHHLRGDRVAVAFLTSGELGLKSLSKEQAWSVREAEARRAAHILRIARVEFFRLPDWSVEEHTEAGSAKLSQLLATERPGMVYTPHEDDEHPDHAASVRLLTGALQRTPGLCPSVLAYEVWSPLSRFDQVEDISAVMTTKLEAIAAYESQLTEFRYDRAAEGLAAYRGALGAKVEFAEVFATVR